MAPRGRRVIGTLASAVDRAVTAAVRLGQNRARAEDELSDEARIELLEATRAFYAGRSDIFGPVKSIAPLCTRAGDSWDVAWPSSHRVLDERLCGELERYPINGTCHARVRSRDSGRPAAIFVHGYLAGDFEFGERVWPLARFEALGFDTALFTLPFHGLRVAPHLRRNPPFPGRDPALTVEGFRQAVGDLRELVHWFRGRGASAVGLVGMSLGGYTAALTATVERDLAFLVPVIPLACLADFAREQGSLPRSASVALRYEAALRDAYRVVSPLERASLIEPGRTLVIGAQADRITHVSHARRIAHHFSAPLHTWPGGHLVQWGRSEAFDRVESFLRGLGLTRD